MKIVTIIPRISEKAYLISKTGEKRTYVFTVPTNVNKHTIARHVAEQYEVAVEDVRTVLVKGKAKQTYRKGARPTAGKRSDFKKAYVTLQAGHTLPIFAEEEAEAVKEAEVVKKEDKKAAKKTSKKETK
jgi:large subunit ribosomal protein L23